MPVSPGTVAALFRDHHGELVRLAVLMVGDLPTAEDVVQDVYASLHSRPSQPDDPLPYVRAAVLNGCRSVLRRRGIARRVSVVHRASAGDEALASAESEVIVSEDRRQVLAALARLPRRRREVLVLRYYFLVLWCGRGMSVDLCQAAVGPASSRTQQVRSIPVTAAGGSLARGTVLLSQRGSPGGTLPPIAHALAGPQPGELTLVLLSGRTTTTGFWPVATVERVAASTGSVLGVSYRLVDRRPAASERYVELGADPSGQHQLLTYSVQAGLRTGWIGQHELHPFPGPQPYPGYPVTA